MLKRKARRTQVNITHTQVSREEWNSPVAPRSWTSQRSFTEIQVEFVVSLGLLQAFDGRPTSLGAALLATETQLEKVLDLRRVPFFKATPTLSISKRKKNSCLCKLNIWWKTIEELWKISRLSFFRWKFIETIFCAQSINSF